jgi:ATP-dependent Lon protease
MTDTIPAPLFDRMEVMRLSGYITDEKIKIARKFIVPKQLKEHGLKSSDFKISNSAIKDICEFYARESGVRNLEKNLKKLMRKCATLKARSRADSESTESTESTESKESKESKGSKESADFKQLKISSRELEEYLGKKRMPADEEFGILEPGLVTGLAWTSLGGARLYIESIAVKSDTPAFKLTGQLGDVMTESAKIAFSYVKSIAHDLGINKNFFKNHALHLHVPAGATPKDGPSAGITMASSLISLALNKKIKKNTAMTGELTLSGRVLPVGGIKEKIIAAKRGKIKEIIIPFENRPDYHELPDHIKKDVKVWFVKRWPEAARVAFEWKSLPDYMKKIKEPLFLTGETECKA